MTHCSRRHAALLHLPVCLQAALHWCERKTLTVMCSRQFFLERPHLSAPYLGLQRATLKVLVSPGAGSLSRPRSATAATDKPSGLRHIASAAAITDGHSQLGQEGTAEAGPNGVMGEAAGEQTALHEALILVHEWIIQQA